MMMRIHFHTDCPWFAGCETMLGNLLSSPEIRGRFDVSLSYRATERYTAGLTRVVPLDFRVFPLGYPDTSDALPVPAWTPRTVRRGARFLSREIGTIPLFLYQVWLLRRLFLRLRPEVLHINNGGYPAALSARAAAIAGRMARVPHIIMVVNNLAEEYRRPWGSLRRAIDRRVVGAVSHFLTGSAAASTRLRAVLDLRDDHAKAFPNGVALRSTTETQAETRSRLGVDTARDEVLFGVVALMEARKGHRVLFEAVAKLVREKGDAERNFLVLLAGDGPLRAELEAFVETAGLQHRCRFVGHEDNVANFMAMIDVLVLPSIANEDFPNVILEAMGFGKPVIASRVAGTPEQVVHEETGLLVEPADVTALADAMRRLAVDPATRDRMGSAGRARFREMFTAEISVKRYTELYQSFIGRANQS